MVDCSLVPVRVRLLPTVSAGCPEGCNSSAYWGFLAHTLLCGSKNPLIGYGIFRLSGNTLPALASNPSYIAVPSASSALRMTCPVAPASWSAVAVFQAL